MKMGARLAFALFRLCARADRGKADDDQADRKACMKDALTVCAKFIPDRERIAAACMTNQRQSRDIRTALLHSR